eukprot:TRINITY_DN42662_c0_g1_i1.p1 TRINITY_DN42662_c0_g1~~TRINITY_DN42662_c0_g1_i1.p1  ORF type:complete len:385 (+),score=66.20 TRINITY_DN42662_c0_g1_i1:116-1270(+)
MLDRWTASRRGVQSALADACACKRMSTPSPSLVRRLALPSLSRRRFRHRCRAIALAVVTLKPLGVARGYARDCWGKDVVVEESARCCDTERHGPEGDASCFDKVFTFRLCCLNVESPFRTWPMDIAVVGLPHAGTTSVARYLEAAGATIVGAHTNGTRADGFEMQAMDHLLLQGEAAIARFGRQLRRERRRGGSDRKLLMRNPTMIYDLKHLWALDQISGLTFVVMLRDPMAWLASTICRRRCSEALERRRLCRNGIPVLHAWIRACSKLDDWSLCAGLPHASPRLARTVAPLLELIKYNKARVIVLSLESLMERPREVVNALSQRLGLPRLALPQLQIWSRAAWRRVCGRYDMRRNVRDACGLPAGSVRPYVCGVRERGASWV